MYVALFLLLCLAFQQTPPSSAPNRAQPDATQPQTYTPNQAAKGPNGISPASADYTQTYSPTNTQQSDDGYEKWLYHSYEWATIIGVAAGWLVLFFIWRQTQSVIQAERAWIMVAVKPPAKQPMVNSGRSNVPPHEYTRVHVVLFCQNQGRSPAWILEQHVRAEIIDRKNVPVRPDFNKEFKILKETRPAPVNIEVPRSIELPLPGHVGEDNEGVPQTILVYGFIVYRDIFSKKHKTVFGSCIYGTDLILSLDSEAYHETT
jgi:hypothetical protein